METQLVDRPTKTDRPRGLPPLDEIQGGPLEEITVGLLVGIGLLVLVWLARRRAV